VLGYEAPLRARRRKARGWEVETKELYQRHRWRVEGKHGEAKTAHGLRRAVRRGRWNVAIQAYLTAAVMNLKCLAALLLIILNWLCQQKLTSDRPVPATTRI
jgi:IS5 family transposase